MTYLENLEQIKNNIKEKYKLSRCSLSEKENLQLVLHDKLSNEQLEEIAEYCKKELEILNSKKYTWSTCKTESKYKISNVPIRLIFYREQGIQNINN